VLAPKETIAKGKKLAGYPGTMSIVCLILAAIVLYYLTQAGVTIVQILAVTLFVNLLAGVAFAPYAKAIYKQINPKTLVREQWLFMLIVIALIVWGVKEIFF
jgi:hypothetical protein